MNDPGLSTDTLFLPILVLVSVLVQVRRRVHLRLRYRAPLALAPVVLALLGGALLTLGSQFDALHTTALAQSVPNANAIGITSTGFQPSLLAISAVDSANWINTSSQTQGVTAQAALHSLLLTGNAAAEAAASPDLNLTRDWTVETWFKDEAAGDPEDGEQPVRVLVSKGSLTALEVPYFVVFGNDMLRVGLRWHGETHVIKYRMRHARDGQPMWHHVAATFQAVSGELRLYVDGIFVATKVLPVPGSLGNRQALDIGRRVHIVDDEGAQAEGWHVDYDRPGFDNQSERAERSSMKIDDVRLWSMVRSPAQIQASFGLELVSPQTGLWRTGSSMKVAARAPRTALARTRRGLLEEPVFRLTCRWARVARRQRQRQRRARRPPLPPPPPRRPRAYRAACRLQPAPRRPL